MQIYLFDGEEELANCAAEFAVKKLQASLKKKNMACFVVATGRSQIKLLKSLTECHGLDWNKTVMFHLDEFVGISQDHPASFQKYIHERFTDIVHPAKAHFIHGDYNDLKAECERLNRLISQYIVDLVFVGIGMNGHLAFNDPPADFVTETPYRIVRLDRRNRQQQREYFPSIEQVPKLAISMSIRQIMKAEAIICLATGKSKVEIVLKSLQGKVTPECPASILQQHPNVSIFLDEEAASLLPGVFIRKYSAKR
jgi:glucosamine-6-phosphate deaminase